MKQPRQPLRTKINTSNKKKRLETNDTFDPVIAAEDRELQRLERLLGIKKKGNIYSSFICITDNCCIIDSMIHNTIKYKAT